MPIIKPNHLICYAFAIVSFFCCLNAAIAQNTYSYPVQLNGQLEDWGDTLPSRYQISLDNQRVVYRADQDFDGVFEVYSVPINGGTAIKLNGNTVTGGYVSEFKISADSQRVVYRADQRTKDIHELYSVPATGGNVARINGNLYLAGPMVPNSYDFSFEISTDSQHVIFQAYQATNDDPFELFSTSLRSNDDEMDELCFPIKAQNNKLSVVCL